MSDNKNKSRSFSIYLLKEKFNAKNALKAGHTLGKPVNAKHLPADTVLYVLDNVPKDPWWKDFWGVNKDLKQVLKGAIAFVKVDRRTFALTFGHAYHHLKPECYEYDFGLLTTLNAVDPEKIKSTDIFMPETARRERIQSPIAAELTFFDVNSDESIFKSLAGAVKSEYSDLIRHVSGSSNVRLNSKIVAQDISELCLKLLEIYKSDDYKTTFPNIQNIQPVKDPVVINALDDLLVKEIKNKSDNIALTIPDIFNPNTSSQVKYSGSGRAKETFDEVNINGFYEYLKERKKKPTDIDFLKKHELNIQNENGYVLEKYSIYKSIIFDCENENEHYHLCDGQWYAIDKNYLQDVSKYLDGFFVQRADLIECDDRKESDYNSNLAKNDTSFVCLDMKNISPKGQTQIEPCDLYTVKNHSANLIHIKISTRSSSLSHLFNQGVNSVELIRLNEEARDKLKELVSDKGAAYIDNSSFTVTFGIVTHKPCSENSKALPLFSKISLKRALNALELMAVKAEVVLIKDNVNR